MIRTVINLAPEQKAWLDLKACETGKSMTAVVRDAVARYRAEDAKRDKPPLAGLLESTRGI
jgi:hypothetical protein